MAESVTFTREDNIAIFTLNEPETRNAISPAIVQGIVDACDRVNEDTSISCVVVTGAGKSFSSGGNVKDMYDRTGLFSGSPAEARRGYQHGIQRIPMALNSIEVPTIAAVNGHAVGAGLDLALMCDMRIAAEGAEFAESFLRVGLISGDGGSWFLPKVIGLSRAYELTFTADFIDTKKAMEWGMISSVHPGDKLLAEALALARRIARHPPTSVRLCKKLMRESQAMSLSASLEMAAGMQALVQHSDDQTEALHAFLDKRAPRFTGR